MEDDLIEKIKAIEYQFLTPEGQRYKVDNDVNVTTIAAILELTRQSEQSIKDEREKVIETITPIFYKYLQSQARDSAGKCNGGLRCVLDKEVIDEIIKAIQENNQ
jgi:hypothetical protein